MKKRLIVFIAPLMMILLTFLTVKLFINHTQVQRTRKEAGQSQFKKEVTKKASSGNSKKENNKDKKDTNKQLKEESSLTTISGFSSSIPVNTSESNSKATSESNNGQIVTESTPNNPNTPISIPLPSSSIGNWIYKDEANGIDITITISPDGTITKVNNNEKITYIPKTQSVHISDIYDRGNGNYQITFKETTVPFILAIGGIGGENVQYNYGMRIDGDFLKSIIWQTGINKEFDYTQPLFGQNYTRQ